MMSEDENRLIVNVITSISLIFRSTVEVTECLNTYDVGTMANVRPEGGHKENLRCAELQTSFIT